MNNWNLIINLSIGAVGLILSFMGLFMSHLSRLIEVHTRRHLSGMLALSQILCKHTSSAK